MIHIYRANALHFLNTYDGPNFDAVITDPPYASGGATASQRRETTADKYTSTKSKCPYPDFAGDQMDARSWTRMMAEVFEAARAHCADGAVLAAFCDWRQMPALSDAIQWAGWTWRGTVVWDKLSSRPQKGRYRQQAEFVLWASNGKLPMDRPVPVLPGVYAQANVSGSSRMHQTQKPLLLMQKICRICVPGGRILDPFCGSGSTIEAARLEGYDAVGVEVLTQIAQTAAERLGVPLREWRRDDGDLEQDCKAAGGGRRCGAELVDGSGRDAADTGGIYGG